MEILKSDEKYDIKYKKRISYKKGNLIKLKYKDIICETGDNVQKNFKRTFVVISGDTNNRFSPTINVCAITKNEGKSKYPQNTLIYKCDHDCLEYNSTILTNQIFTINRDLVEYKTGSLNNSEMDKLNHALRIQLDL